MANNLKANNGTVPGIRPGAPTADYIRKILSRITLIGAMFLAVIAMIPLIYGFRNGTDVNRRYINHHRSWCSS